MEMQRDELSGPLPSGVVDCQTSKFTVLSTIPLGVKFISCVK